MARVVRAHKTGGPEVMQLDEVQLPPPAAGQALVRIEAAGVNFIDIYHCSGQYQMQQAALKRLLVTGQQAIHDEHAGDVLRRRDEVIDAAAGRQPAQVAVKEPDEQETKPEDGQ